VTTVLIADDHAFIRTGIAAVLRGSRFEVVAQCADGTEALAKVAELNPDVCVFDIRMPGTDGVAALEALRDRGDRRPVILLTADLEDAHLLAAVRAGVNGLVLKEGAEDSLLDCLEAVAAGRRSVAPPLLERALDLSIAGEKPNPFTSLAPREAEIVEHVGRGLRNREIAQAIGMTEGTVKVYLHTIYQKLGVENRTELAILALEEKRR
jgi:two-component system, NarL family, nitrate/nitrite response regulator NarL